MTDEELWADLQAAMTLPPDEEDDGVSGTPEGDYFWRLTHLKPPRGGG